MNHPTHKDVTYIGREDPFLDRNYGSGLEFVPGQTRNVPAALAARFLQHTDCFEQPKPEAAKPAKAAAVVKPVDDTQEKLDQQQKDEAARRDKDNKTFELHQQIDSMTKAAVVEFVETNFKEKLDMKLSKADLQSQAKSLVDQFGVA